MLEIPKGKICYVGTCDKCHTTLVELDEDRVDDARADLVKLGWLECARSGVGRERWHWWCPSCNPSKRASSAMLTTGTFMPDGSPDSDD